MSNFVSNLVSYRVAELAGYVYSNMDCYGLNQRASWAACTSTYTRTRRTVMQIQHHSILRASRASNANWMIERRASKIERRVTVKYDTRAIVMFFL